MRFETVTSGKLREAERQVIALLRAWRAGEAAQEWMALHLTGIMGETRAQQCLDGFATLTGLLQKHGWHGLTILPETATGWSEDELSVARFVMAATEQRREVALAEASFLVSPVALLPLLTAATRCGLPLLCAECRMRIMGSA